MSESTHPADESNDGARIDTTRAAMQQALRLIEDEGHKADLLEAASILRAALAEQKCPCGDRPADQCPGEWEPGCDLGANEKHAKVATADASLGAAIEAIDAALAEQAQPTSEAGWLHRLDMEKSEAWMAGYAQGLKRAAEQAQPVAYRHLHEDGWEYYDAPTADDCAECQPLYTTPPAPVAPPGWRMVPEEPTEAMLSAAQSAWLRDPARKTTTMYRAMLAATPPAPVVPQPLTDEQIMCIFDDAVPDYVDVTDAEMIDFARAVEAAVIARMGVQR